MFEYADGTHSACWYTITDVPIAFCEGTMHEMVIRAGGTCPVDDVIAKCQIEQHPVKGTMVNGETVVWLYMTTQGVPGASNLCSMWGGTITWTAP